MLDFSLLRLPLCAAAVVTLSACADFQPLSELDRLLGSGPAPLQAVAADHPKPAESARTSQDEVLDFVARAATGESGIVKSSDSGTTVRVTVDRLYYAASGRQCRQYQISLSEGGASMAFGLACRNADGSWNRARALINPEL